MALSLAQKLINLGMPPEQAKVIQDSLVQKPADPDAYSTTGSNLAAVLVEAGMMEPSG